MKSAARLVGLAGLGGFLVASWLLRRLLKQPNPPSLLFSAFLKDLRSGRVRSVRFIGGELLVRLKDSAAAAVGAAGAAAAEDKLLYRTKLIPVVSGSQLSDALSKHGVRYGSGNIPIMRRLAPALVLALPFAYLAAAGWMLWRVTNPSSSVGKRKKARSSLVRALPTFDDVAGVDAAKVEVMEVVDQLKHPDKYAAMGARLPRGVLLCGPSGTGKTLLARAVAAESGSSFIACSASDFVEMLVGRGAARVRDVFNRAADNAPSVLFIDELDALGKARGGLNSHDEREQTLLQLLTEMDGFDSSGRPVVVMAATNRRHVLDPALLRPGRFDRIVRVPLPDEEGRRAILDVHARKVKTAPDMDLHAIAAATEGCSGADLASIINDAALLAVRMHRPAVDQDLMAVALARWTASRGDHHRRHL